MMSPKIVCASEISPPPPNPCRARAKASTKRLGASAQAAEPTTNSTIAISKAIRRPWMSLNLP